MKWNGIVSQLGHERHREEVRAREGEPRELDGSTPQ